MIRPFVPAGALYTPGVCIKVFSNMIVDGSLWSAIVI